MSKEREKRHNYTMVMASLSRLETSYLDLEESGDIDKLEETMSEEDWDELQLHLAAVRDNIYYALDILRDNNPE